MAKQRIDRKSFVVHQTTRQQPQIPKNKKTVSKPSISPPKNSKTKTGRLATARKTVGMNHNNKFKLQSNSMDLLGDIVGTISDVSKTVGTMAVDPLAGALQLPNSIMKVVDTGKEVIKSFNPEKSIPTQDIALKGQIPLNPQSKEQRIIDKIARIQPVVMTQSVPSSYNTTVKTNAITTEEVKVVGPMGRGSAKGIRVRGSQLLAAVHYVAGGTAGFTSAHTARVAPGDTGVFGDRCSHFSSLYQRWRINGCTVFYVPNQPTDRPGTVSLSFLDGTFDNHSDATADGISQRESVITFRATESGSLTFPFTPRDLWVSPSDLSYDPKFYIQGIFQAFSDGNASDYWPHPAGYLYTSYDVTFYSAAEDSFDYANLLRRCTFDAFLNSNLGSLPAFLKKYNHYVKILSREWAPTSSTSNPLMILAKSSKQKDKISSIGEEQFLQMMDLDDYSTINRNKNLLQVFTLIDKLVGDEVYMKTPVSKVLKIWIKNIFKVTVDHATMLGLDPMASTFVIMMSFAEAYYDLLYEIKNGPRELLGEFNSDDEEDVLSDIEECEIAKKKVK